MQIASSDSSRHQFTHRGLRLSYLDSAPGDPDRPVVLLVHGFPDSAAMWEQQIRFLHAHGYRCIAPDTVGCGESQIAERLRDYNCRGIVSDLVALLDHLGVRRAHVVGHDWGAILSWMLAAWHPDRVNRLVAMSVGHPMAYARSGIDQKLAGWYIAFFMLARLAEKLLMGRGRFSLRNVFGSHPDMDEVMARLSAPGRLTAALRIYRAGAHIVLFNRHPAVKAPTLGIWSRGDAFLVESQMRNSDRWVDADWQSEVIDGGHWIPLEQPDYLNQRILRHLQENPAEQ